MIIGEKRTLINDLLRNLNCAQIQNLVSDFHHLTFHKTVCFELDGFICYSVYVSFIENKIVIRKDAIVKVCFDDKNLNILARLEIVENANSKIN